jgi:FkbM family methyltransferase
MTFISYAQNLEDVLLWRALRDVDNGFYIDVGAADPDEDSVTSAFYRRGWRGINVEPEPAYAARLRAARPRDLNLQLALGAMPGRAVFQRMAGTGLSTLDAGIAAEHARAGFATAEPLEVEIVKLSAVCDQHAPATIHFLKIDVEGAEREVLLGADLRRHRPWIILVEATRPKSPERASEKFEDLLFAAGYRECWFDGLNTWYLAEEHDARLRGCFMVPPNIFDDYVPHRYQALISQAEQRLAGIQRSSSWRLTAPLRALARGLRGS